MAVRRVQSHKAQKQINYIVMKTTVVNIDGFIKSYPNEQEFINWVKTVFTENEDFTEMAKPNESRPQRLSYWTKKTG